MKRSGWIAVVGVLVFIAGLAGIGLLIYQAGMAQGAAAGVEMSERFHPIVWGRPLLIGFVTILLLVFLFRLVAPLIFFPLFGYHIHRRFPDAPMHKPWRYLRGWDYEGEIPDFIKGLHEHLHQEDRSAEDMDAEA